MILKSYKRYIAGNSGNFNTIWRQYADINSAVEVEKPGEKYYKAIELSFNVQSSRNKVRRDKAKERIQEIKLLELAEVERLTAKYTNSTLVEDAREARQAIVFNTNALNTYTNSLTNRTAELNIAEEELNNAKTAVADAIENLEAASTREERKIARANVKAMKDILETATEKLNVALSNFEGASILYEDAIIYLRESEEYASYTESLLIIDITEEAIATRADADILEAVSIIAVNKLEAANQAYGLAVRDVERNEIQVANEQVKYDKLVTAYNIAKGGESKRSAKEAMDNQEIVLDNAEANLTASIEKMDIAEKAKIDAEIEVVDTAEAAEVAIAKAVEAELKVIDIVTPETAAASRIKADDLDELSIAANNELERVTSELDEAKIALIRRNTELSSASSSYISSKQAFDDATGTAKHAAKVIMDEAKLAFNIAEEIAKSAQQDVDTAQKAKDDAESAANEASIKADRADAAATEAERIIAETP